MDSHSAHFYEVLTYFNRGDWDADRVANAVDKKWITEAESKEILSQNQ